MSYIWVLFALIASFSNSFRDLYIKKHIKADAQLVVTSTRMIAFILMLCMAPLFLRETVFNGSIRHFVFYLIVTVVLTIVATSLKINIIQKEELSKSSPLLSLTPIFIVPWAMILLNEKIDVGALCGLLFSMIGVAVILDMRISKTMIKDKKLLFQLLIVLMIYGLTTVIDKIEIGMTGAYLYSLIWTGSSAIAGLYVIKKQGVKNLIENTVSKTNILQSILWAASFLSQQLAVQYSYELFMNTAYIKSIMYIGIIVNVVLGGKIFRERKIIQKLVGSVILILGNLILIF